MRAPGRGYPAVTLSLQSKPCMKLRSSPGACSLWPHIVLREAGLPFTPALAGNKTHQFADGTNDHTINPKGCVPLRELDDGQRLSKGPAIVQSIADQVPDKKLAPPAGSMARCCLMGARDGLPLGAGGDDGRRPAQVGGAAVRRRGVLAWLCMAPAARAQGAPTPSLVAAAGRGDLAEVRRLLDAGAAVNARDGRGRNAVLAATQGGHEAVARALIERGADVNAQDEIDDSAFLLAGASGHTGIARAALAARPPPDFKRLNRYGGTALIPACHHGHVETVRLLVTTGIDIDHVNRLGWTALLEAIILGDGGAAHTEIVRILLAHRADPNLADREGVTPLAHAQRRGQREIAQLLRAAGARERR